MFLKVVLKKIIIAAIYFIFALSMELITFSVLNLGIPKYLLFDISILLFLSAILFVIPGIKGQIVLSSIFLFIQGLLSFLNSILFKIDGSFFSIEMMQTGGEGIAAFNIAFLNVPFTLIIFGLILLSIAIFILLNKFFKTKTNFKMSIIMLLVSVCVTMQFFSFGLFKIQLSSLYPAAENKGNVFLDDELLYDTLEIKHEALKKFGSFGFYYKNFQNVFFNDKIDINDIEKLKEYFLNNDSQSINSPYNGVSKNNNIIMIMCESLEWYAISKELTPHLYELKNENIYNDKFYSNNKTNVSEGLGFLGNYPKKTAFSKDYSPIENATQFTTPFSLPNILKEQNYTSKYFHDYEGDFYGRSVTHKNIFGFDDFTDIYGMNDKNKYNNYLEDISKNFGDWVLDSQMLKACLNEIAPSDGSKFFSFVTTVTTHGPYDGNDRLKPYVNEIKNKGLYNNLPGIKDMSLFASDKQKERIVNYIAAAMDLDRAIETLMDYLENTKVNGANLIDNTTVILYADHWAYYQELNYLAKNLSSAELYNPELYRIPFFIVDKKLQKALNNNNDQLSYNINSYMSAYDIMPTVLDLLGYTYNTKIFLGQSVFLKNKAFSCLVSSLSGFFNDRLFTYNGIDFLYQDESVTEKDKLDFKNYLIEFVKKQSYIDLIYMLKDSNIEFSFDDIFIAKKNST